MYIILVYMLPLSTYTFISCLGRQIVSWPGQGSQRSLEKPKLMVLQHEFQEEFLDFHGMGVVHAKGSLEVSPWPPPNLSTPTLQDSSCAHGQVKLDIHTLESLFGERLRALTYKRIEVIARYVVTQFIF